MEDPLSLIVTLWSSGSLAGSAFLGGVLGNLVASGLFEWPTKAVWERIAKSVNLSVCFSSQPLASTSSIEHVRAGLPRVAEPDLLLEWIWTIEGFYYCDARSILGRGFGDLLPSMFWEVTDSVVLQSIGDATTNERTLIDALDCENQEAAVDGDTIVCVNGALLSHFVTRAIGRKVGVIWARSSIRLFG